MNKIEKITPQVCDLVRAELMTFLEPKMNELGLKINLGRMGYNNNSIGVKIDLTVEGAKTREEVKSEYDLKIAKMMHKDIDFDKESTLNGIRPNLTLKIVGYNTRARKKPFECVCVKTGKRYGLTEAQAKQWFPLKENATA
jgi:hypothetical protein